MENNQEHYIVIAKWQADLEGDVDILAVEHTVEKAREVFGKRLEKERAFAEEHGFEVYTDDDLNFDAGLPGHYADGHIHLYVQMV